MKPTPEQVARFATGEFDQLQMQAIEAWTVPPQPPEPIPGPYQLAREFAAALLASGQFQPDNSEAAVAKAWSLVLPFYQGKQLYLDLASGLAGMVASVAEGDLSADEARAYVTGGETGQTGEAAAFDRQTRQGQQLNVGVPVLRGSETIILTGEAAADRAKEIAESGVAVQAAAKALEDAEVNLAFAQDQKGTPKDTLVSLRNAAERAKADFDQACERQSAAYL